VIPILVVAAGLAVALGARWPAMLAAGAVLGLLAARPPGSLPTRPPGSRTTWPPGSRTTRLLICGALLALAAAIIVPLWTWREITPGTDLAALVTDPAQTFRDAIVAVALIVACLLFAVAVLRHLPAGRPPRAAAPLTIGGLLLVAQTWLVAESVWDAYTARFESGDDIEVTAIAVAVAADPAFDMFSGLAMAATLTAAALLTHGCAANLAE
jgi:hypothetical protein